LNGMSSKSNLMKCYHAFQTLLVRDTQTDRQTDLFTVHARARICFGNMISWLFKKRSTRSVSEIRKRLLSFLQSLIHQYYETGYSVSIVSDYRLEEHSSTPDEGKGFLLWPLCPHRFLDPPSLLSNGYRGSFQGVNSAGA
jgi:hypothetical protein